MFKRFSPYKTYLIFSLTTAIFFYLVFTASMVYQIDKVGLNPFQLILVGTTLEGACFIFEIPTGIVADVYSRRLSIVIGIALIGIGFILEGAVAKFIAVMISQLLWGIGYTFISGSVEAWIADEEKTLDLNRIYLKGAQIEQAGSIIGIILSVALANINISLPIILGGISFIVLAVFLIFFMPEDNFKPVSAQDLNSFQKMIVTFKSSLEFIKSKPVLLLLFIVALFYGLSSEGYDRLSTAHFLKDTVLPKIWNLKPVTWFGIFSILGMILSAIAMQIIIKRLEKNDKLQSAAILLATNIFYIIFMLAFALGKSFIFVLIAYLSTNMCRTIKGPIYNAWLNSHVEGKFRATVISANGQIDALGQILGGPVIGLIATRFSISIGIASTAILLVPIIAFYSLLISWDKRLR